MSSINYIKRVYRNPAWRCKCGASSFKPQHKRKCPIRKQVRDTQKEREELAKVKNPKKYLSRTWNQVCGVTVRKSNVDVPIPQQVEVNAKSQDKTKTTNKLIEIRDAWRDDLKPAWGMELAETQGKITEEIVAATCEPTETVVQASDGRWLRIDQELLTQWPKDEAGCIIPPPCVSFWEPKDYNTGFKTGELRIQNGCVNYDNCPFNHQPLPLPIDEHEQPDKPEILYGVSMVTRMPLDEYIIHNKLQTVGEGEFWMTFNEGSAEAESDIDAFVTAWTGIPVDDIPADEVMLADNENWRLDAAVARNTLGVISGAYREVLRHNLQMGETNDFHKALEEAAESCCEDDTFDRVEECIADQMWHEKHDELNGGRVKAVSKGRDWNDIQEYDKTGSILCPSNAFHYMSRSWMCTSYASRGFTNARAKGLFSVTKRGLRALTHHIERGDVTRKDLIVIRHHIRRCARVDQSTAEYLKLVHNPCHVRIGTERITITIAHKAHKLHKAYREFIDVAKKRWHEVPKR